jgi:hypothetical protein
MILIYDDATANPNTFNLFAMHNTFQAVGSVIRLTCQNPPFTPGDYGHMVLLNNILHAIGGDCIYYDCASDLIMPCGEGNVFWAPAGNLVNDVFSGVVCATIAEVQDRYGWNGTSYNEEPVFQGAPGVLRLAASSLLLGRGKAAAPVGLEGGARATAIDPGAWQQSNPNSLELRTSGNRVYFPAFSITIN